MVVVLDDQSKRPSLSAASTSAENQVPGTANEPNAVNELVEPLGGSSLSRAHTPAPPPPYTPSTPGSAFLGFTTPLLAHDVERAGPKRRALSRFLRALVIALGLIVVANVLVFASWASYSGRRTPERSEPPPHKGPADKPGGGTDDPQTPWSPQCSPAISDSYLILELPLNRSKITFRMTEKWNVAHGQITFVQATQGQDHDEHKDGGEHLRIDVHTKDSRPKAEQDSSVCTRVTDSGYALEFVTAKTTIFKPNSPVAMNVTVTFPYIHHASGPLVVPHFATQLPKFSHLFRDLGTGVQFQNVSALSRDAPILTEGWLNVSDALLLGTTNSPIHTNVSLLNVDELSPALVSISTANAPIIADFVLEAPPSQSGMGGIFLVGVGSVNGDVHTRMLRSPPSANVTLQASTMNAKAIVSLDPAFEGQFKLDTIFADVRVDEAGGTSIADPSGQGRERHIQLSQSESVAFSKNGEIWWGSSSVGKSIVEVATVNDAIELIFNDGI